jgi:hypothetical protein
MRLHRVVAGCALALSAHGVTLADTPLGPYIGAAGGQADLRMDHALTDTFNNISKHDTGWQVMAGIRPLRFLGAELEYVNFGSRSYLDGLAPGSYPFAYTTGTIDAKAAALLAVLYAPLPVKFLDVYGKVGPARLQTSVHGLVQEPDLICLPDPDCGHLVTHGATTTDLAYGAGLQLKFGAAAIRAEYERIRVNTGDPSLASLGLTWSF